MLHDALAPALPPGWPYARRPILASLGCREDQVLPGLGGGWRICTPGGEVPAGEAAPLGGAFGRGGILRVGGTVLRPYRRGGFLHVLNERTYRSSLRFAAEHAIHRTLWEAGFPTVEPLGYAWRPQGWGVEGVFLTRLAEGEPWPRHWELSGRVLPRLDQAIDALCAWGLWAPDLNATNVLLPSGDGILLMDWDRAHFSPGTDLRPRYAARLARSLRKLGAPPEAFSPPAPAAAAPTRS